MCRGILSFLLVKVVLILSISHVKTDELTIDADGYVAYCPCMGK